MAVLSVIQWLLNIGLICTVIVLAARIARKSSEDPRLSRGLQLLTSKLAVLEDLSDRTDVQVKQLITLLEHKIKEVQGKVELADQHVQLIKGAMQKSLEVAQIFQEKIPHEEIVSRQNSKRYVQAARMANQGVSAEEISSKLDIPQAEAELIVKVNKNGLTFDEGQLPGWMDEFDHQKHSAKAEAQEKMAIEQQAENERRSEELLAQLQKVQWQLEKLEQSEQNRRKPEDIFEPPPAPSESSQRLTQEFKKLNDRDRENLVEARKISQDLAQMDSNGATVRPVQFRKISMPSRM